MAEPDGRMVIDQIVLICRGCKVERLFYPKPILIGADALIGWLQTKPHRCSCGAATCDVKARMLPTVEADLVLGADIKGEADSGQ